MPLSLDETLLYAPGSGAAYRRDPRRTMPTGRRCYGCALHVPPYPCMGIPGNARNKFVVDSCRNDQSAPPFVLVTEEPK